MTEHNDLIERVARAILEADTTEMLFQDGFPERDATKLAKAAIEAAGVEALQARVVERAVRVGKRAMEPVDADGAVAFLNVEAGIRAAIASLAALSPVMNDGVVEALKLTTSLLTRYRVETPPGHSPHMICHVADEAIERANAAIAALSSLPTAITEDAGNE